MTSYYDWNQALISYFLNGVPKGNKIYLSVDDEVIDLIGKQFLKLTSTTDSSKDFIQAVRDAVVLEDKVILDDFKELDFEKNPRGVAFLALSVLAASRMSEDNQEEISEKDYFTRLRSLLGLSGEGRPNGMKFGSQSEERLWKQWNLWLLEQGFQPTAYKGMGPQKYIKYPIEQTLLRQVDKDKLQDLFIKKGWKISWDGETLYTKVYPEISTLSKHLQKLLQDRKRSELLAESIYDVHQQWLAEGCPSTTIKRVRKRTWSKNLFAGIYRTEDLFLGEVAYYLYPKQQRGRELDSLEINYHNSKQILRNDRQGWFLPLENALTSENLDNGIEYAITSTHELEKLILPARDFWILIPDPDEPESGIYATWRSPELGEQFILLCKKDLLPDLELLKNERLLEWREKFAPFGDDSIWIEIDRCQVLSQAWDGIFPSNLELKQALQPKTKLSISLKNGLQIPHQKCWLKGYAPDVTIYGFYPTVKLKVRNLITEEIVLDEDKKTNKPFCLNLHESGNYLITASYGSDFTERFLKLKSWDELEMTEVDTHKIKQIENHYSISRFAI